MHLIYGNINCERILKIQGEEHIIYQKFSLGRRKERKMKILLSQLKRAAGYGVCQTTYQYFLKEKMKIMTNHNHRLQKQKSQKRGETIL